MRIKNTTFVILFTLLITIVINGCKREDQTRFQAGWSAKDPIAIPYNIRNHEKTLGNLVINPSFETGKVYYEESNIKSYDIIGWKKVGENIKWVNSNNGEYEEGETFEGTHSIKIERDTADETELTGEGIISDFIKVIPGNYLFKLFLRLEDICPNQARIGIKMHDAVNIRLLYFDKNKIEINGIEFDAFQNKKIDNTFKSYSLSNYWNIDEFGWGEIRGKTANYPFFDGDIPDNARYVKIFIGLKGTGKMWIDNIDFRFTDENFTMLERLKPYFDSSYLANDMVFPQPKQLTKKSQVEFFNKDSALYPIIVVPVNTSKIIKESALKLKDMLISKIKTHDNKLTGEIKIVTNIDLNKISEKQFIVSIGNNDFYNIFKANLPDSLINDNEGAYYIVQSENRENLVFINGYDDEAIKYAFLSFNQLFDTQSTIYFGANIIDYPDFLERAFILHYFDGDLNDLDNKLELLNQYKFNNVYFEWHGGDNEKHYPFNSINELQHQSNSMNFSVLVDLIKLNAKQSLISGKPFDNLNYETLISKSLKSVLFAGDYYQSYDNCNPDKIVFRSNKKMDRNLQFDHIDLINDFNKLLVSKALSTKIEFLSPWNRLDIIDRGQGQAEFYYRDLNRNLSNNIPIYWTGCSYFSKSIDFAEFHRMKKIVGNTTVLFDNSLNDSELRFNSEFVRKYYAGKIRALSIFEPYNFITFNDFYKQSRGRKILLNTNSLSELNTIRILTAANYFWNTTAYDPDKSLWIVLNKLVGRDNAINLLYFNDAYYGLKEICEKLEINGLQFNNLRIAKNFDSDLNKYYKELEISLDNKILLTEIKKLKTEILEKYNNIIITDK
ncbi:MAG: beta-N-acetylglucosaminidase domain-containing protein [Bacteroidales bacterium]|nr:beta-N-acetylglucosaminidase domain-containing protein [Bacteroidales bacterium]